jgi:hypothetical protein
MTLSHTHRRWLASAAIQHLLDIPGADYPAGTAALAALLNGTPAGFAAGQLVDLTHQQTIAIRQILLSLDDETPTFP